MKPRDTAQILDEISREQLPQDLQLLPGVLAKIQHEKQTLRNTSVRTRSAALLLILIVLIILFTRPEVVHALKKLIGYVPGVGTVDQSAPIRVLAGPVTETRDQYTVAVDSAVFDSTRTVISYTAFGEFPIWDDPATRPALCQSSLVLQLSNGDDLAYISSEGGSGGGISQWQVVFPPVPAAEKQVTLLLPCLPDLPAGKGPQNWEFSLALAAAPPELTVFPLVAQPTALSTEPAVFAPAEDIQLSVQSSAALDAGYYLQTLLSWPQDAALSEVQLFPDSVRMVDAAGQDVPVWFADQIPPFGPADAGSMPVNLETGPIPAPGPANLTVEYVGMTVFSTAQFSVDVGADPQPGQTWEINQPLVINGHALKVVSAEYMQTAPGEPAMMMVYLEAGNDVLAVNAMDTQNEIVGTGGSPNSEFTPFRAGWYYKNGFPEGQITVDITRVTLRRTGPWSVSWEPPR